MRNLLFFATMMLSVTAVANGQSSVDFEDVGILLANESFYNGSDGAGGFQAGSLSFNNTFTTSAFGDSWAGWSYSNQTDTTTPGFMNQYSAIFGMGDTGSATYAVAFNGFSGNGPRIQTSGGRTINQLSITNTTYAALSMADGDAFAKKFGGDSGDDEDFFKIDILSLDADDNEIGSVEFFLADYRFSDNSQDYIVDDWTTVDVSSLNATRLGFRFEGSDVGDFGLNTPAYFAVDNVVVAVPEPAAGIFVLLGGLSLTGQRRRRIR